MARPPAIERETVLWLVLDVNALNLTDDRLYRLCRDNEEFNFEMSAQGELIIMSPTSASTDEKNVKIIQRLANWAERDGTGRCYGPSAMFTLPNGAKRSPDAAWLLKSRWNQLTDDQKEGFSKICPDFVVELRSKSDRLKNLKNKMEEYIANGARLGWLLDPLESCATIYRPERTPQVIKNPAILTGDPVLPDFKFDFREIAS